MFETYLELGLRHILDPKAYDHILFIIALCIIYKTAEWKRVLILITAFTIGHSLTLALSTLNYISFDPDLIEFLIPITIIISAFSNLIKQNSGFKTQKLQYTLALIFGFIHGLGFSNYLKSLMGKEESIIAPLFAFNLGVELGQILIVLSTLILSYIITVLFKINRQYYVSAILILIILISIKLLIS